MRFLKRHSRRWRAPSEIFVSGVQTGNDPDPQLVDWFFSQPVTLTIGTAPVLECQDGGIWYAPTNAFQLGASTIRCQYTSAPFGIAPEDLWRIAADPGNFIEHAKIHVPQSGATT